MLLYFCQVRKPYSYLKQKKLRYKTKISLWIILSYRKEIKKKPNKWFKISWQNQMQLNNTFIVVLHLKFTIRTNMENKITPSPNLKWPMVCFEQKYPLYSNHPTYVHWNNIYWGKKITIYNVQKNFRKMLSLNVQQCHCKILK